jgi:hypothetical protein
MSDDLCARLVWQELNKTRRAFVEVQRTTAGDLCVDLWSGCPEDGGRERIAEFYVPMYLGWSVLPAPRDTTCQGCGRELNAGYLLHARLRVEDTEYICWGCVQDVIHRENAKRAEDAPFTPESQCVHPTRKDAS